MTQLSPVAAEDDPDDISQEFVGTARIRAVQPRDRLKAVASGRAALRIEDIESLLTDHVLDTDEQARGLNKTCSQLVEFMFSENKADPLATLSLIRDLSSLSRANAEEMRKTIELLSRIRRQPPPRVQVVAVDGQINVADKQVNTRLVELGGR